MSRPYTANPVPGDFDHRLGECLTHGIWIHWRRAKSSDAYQCSACTLAQPAPDPPDAVSGAAVVQQLVELEAASGVVAKPANGGDAGQVEVLPGAATWLESENERLRLENETLHVQLRRLRNDITDAVARSKGPEKP